MAEPHNIDDILMGVVTPVTPEAPAVTDTAAPDLDYHETPSADNSPEDYPEKLTFNEQFAKDKEEFLADKTEESAENLQNEDLKDSNDDAKPEIKQKSGDVDDYGNELPKERVYTEKEVQQMIRDRLSRGHQAQPPAVQQQQVQQDAKDFTPDLNSDAPWEEQLAQFVDHRLEAREKIAEEKHWKQQEQKVQADFEAKFTTGMDRYKDFAQVTQNMPITNGMMMAARSVADPAAFIYAASKQMPKELERIAQLPDAYQQAAEMGKLEERMRKARNVSKAPRPIKTTRGDLGGKVNDAPSIDQKIHAYGQKRNSRR